MQVHSFRALIYLAFLEFVLSYFKGKIKREKNSKKTFKCVLLMHQFVYFSQHLGLIILRTKNIYKKSKALSCMHSSSHAPITLVSLECKFSYLKHKKIKINLQVPSFLTSICRVSLLSIQVWLFEEEQHKLTFRCFLSHLDLPGVLTQYLGLVI